jgi:hypothetical protein
MANISISHLPFLIESIHLHNTSRFMIKDHVLYVYVTNKRGLHECKQ